MRILWTASVALVAALVGCGDVKTNPGSGGADAAGTGDFTLAVDPASLTIPIAGSGTVTVTVARSGQLGDILLTTPSLPANLTATFSPNLLPAGTDSAELKITAVGGMAAGTSNITVTASAGGVERSETISVTTTTITVSGKVRGDRAMVTVGIVGKSPVMSGAGGEFTFTDVTPPYDLYTLASSGTFSSQVPTVYYFDDLTRPDPIVSAASTFFPFLIFCQIGQTCSQTVSGVRTGAGNNVDHMLVTWSRGGNTTTSNGSYSFTAGGFTNNQSAGNLHGLQYTRNATGAPNGFFYRSLAATLGASAATLDLNLVAVSNTAAITGTLTVPAGYPTSTITMSQQFDLSSAALLPFTSASVDARIPILGAAGFATGFHVSTSTGGATTSYSHPLAGAAANVTYALPAPAALNAPIAGATGVTATTIFGWAAPANMIHRVLFTTTGNSSAQFQVFTRSTQTTIPVVPGLAIPANQSFSWRVDGFDRNEDINQAAATNELEETFVPDFTGPPHAYTTSASRTFTSAQ